VFRNLRLAFEHLKLPFHRVKFAVEFCTALQNGFVLMVHTVFFGQLIFGQIIKIITTSAPNSISDPNWGAYSTPLDLLASWI